MGLADRRVAYENPELDVGDLLADPVAQWQQWYDDAVSAGADEANAMALATIGLDGRPDCRFVLARGADERGFEFFTNLDSPKARQLAASPWAAITFTWMRVHRQVRVRGRIEPVADDDADAYFAGRPRGSQLAAWASPQSAVLADRDELVARFAEVEARFPEPVPVPRPANWGGLRVVPDEFEFWQGRANRLHDRFRYLRRPGTPGWLIDRLAP